MVGVGIKILAPLQARLDKALSDGQSVAGAVYGLCHDTMHMHTLETRIKNKNAGKRAAQQQTYKEKKKLR